MHISFRGSERPTLGVEWELACVDATSGDLVPVGPEVVARCGVDAVKGALLVNTVEAVTGICDTAGEAMEDLTGTVQRIRAVTDPMARYLLEMPAVAGASREDVERLMAPVLAALVDPPDYPNTTVRPP